MLDRFRVGESSCCCCDDIPDNKFAQVKMRKNHMVFKHCKRDSPCDYHLLMSRVLEHDSEEATDPKWKQATLLTPSNPVSGAWNRDYAVDLAAKTGEPLFVVYAEDSRPRARKKKDGSTEAREPLSRSHHRRLWELPDSKTEQRLGKLVLVRGMRVMLRINEKGTELGLTNGAEGTVREIALDPREILPSSAQVTPGGKPIVYRLRYMPKYVVVEFDRVDSTKPLTGMPSKLHIPVEPQQTNFKWSPNSKVKCWDINRTQLPLTPVKSLTVHMAQGRTLPIFVVDLDVTEMNPKDVIAQLYVILSRGQSLQNLRVLRHFAHTVLHYRRGDGLKQEELRLYRLAQQTVMTFE